MPLLSYSIQFLFISQRDQALLCLCDTVVGTLHFAIAFSSQTWIDSAIPRRYHAPPCSASALFRFAHFATASIYTVIHSHRLALLSYSFAFRTLRHNAFAIRIGAVPRCAMPSRYDAAPRLCRALPGITLPLPNESTQCLCATFPCFSLPLPNVASLCSTVPRHTKPLPLLYPAIQYLCRAVSYIASPLLCLDMQFLRKTPLNYASAIYVMLFLSNTDHSCAKQCLRRPMPFNTFAKQSLPGRTKP